MFDHNVMTPELRRHLRTSYTPREEPESDDIETPAIRLVETPTRANKGKKAGRDIDYEDCWEE